MFTTDCIFAVLSLSLLFLFRSCDSYEQELSNYDGPLKVPNKRAKKDPLAPKRAMSAFLHFSQSMRPRLRETYPEAKNMDMSKMLGQVGWAFEGGREGGGFGVVTGLFFVAYNMLCLP